jgi:hypothetical protein
MAPRRRKTAAGRTRLVSPDFEFCVEGPAVSAQAKNRRLLHDWSAKVAAAAQTAWPKGKSLMEGDLKVFVSEFSEFATMDRDIYINRK